MLHTRFDFPPSPSRGATCNCPGQKVMWARAQMPRRKAHPNQTTIFNAWIRADGGSGIAYNQKTQSKAERAQKLRDRCSRCGHGARTCKSKCPSVCTIQYMVICKTKSDPGPTKNNACKLMKLNVFLTEGPNVFWIIIQQHLTIF